MEHGTLSGNGTQFEYDMLAAKAVGSCQVLREIESLEYESIFADELEALEQLKAKLESEKEQDNGE
jgi:hypothetical protein